MLYGPENIPLLRDIIENYRGSILVCDKNGVIIFANNGSQLLTGLSKEELLGHGAAEVAQRLHFNRFTSVDCLERKEVVVGYLVRNDDPSSGVMATSIPIFDENGDIQYVIAYSEGELLTKRFLEQVETEKRKVEGIFNYYSNYDQINGIIVENPQMKSVFQLARNVASVDATVMLYGESGTGKEVLARYIYQNSRRSKEVFVPISCTAIPNELMESEFFGYVKGAFTGANREGKAGLFELADQGTLFLDEIGDLPLPLQAKLLRVLETGEFKRVGGNQILHADVRIIAATNRNLMDMVEKGEFREDLYYRLNVFPLSSRPLRERPEEIEPLAAMFLDRYNKKYRMNAALSPQILEQLHSYPWPGNIRELRNYIERLVITSGTPMQAAAVPGKFAFEDASADAFASASVPAAPIRPYQAFRQDSEKAYFEDVLTRCCGNVTEAAKCTGLHISGVYRKLEKYGINVHQYRI